MNNVTNLPKGYTPVVLIIIDGWGIAPAGPTNPFSFTKDQVLHGLTSKYKTYSLAASGVALGQHNGEQGYSELGHITLSSGRIIGPGDDGVIKNCLPEVVSRASIRQFYIAETKKYGHLTYYFNGRSSNVFLNVDCQLVQGSHIVDYKDYKSHTRMKTPDIAQKIVSKISQGRYGFLATNFPNIDMVAHTRDMDMTLRALTLVGKAVKKIVDVVLSCGGVVVITSDHGNAEHLVADSERTYATHTTNPVPCCIVGADFEVKGQQKLEDMPVSGSIARVAPTILELLGVEKPPEMTEKSLLSHS